MHIGSLRTAIFAYLFARQQGGTFILRIEDTDKAREVEGSIKHIQEALNWFGLEWDYGPDRPGPFGSCLQSDRLDIYRSYAEKLVAKGLAYPDPYTDAEVERFRAQAEAEKRPFLYRRHRPETFGTWNANQPLRLKAPFIKRYHWHDAVRGDLEAGEEMVDDIIIIKADGYPTYNFAHIVDDLEMGVTHIMRGDEFISSMPKFLSIYDALEIPYPIFVTLPPILRPDRSKKLGKRDGAKDILDYRTEGYQPEALLNFLTLIGWNPGTEQEIFRKKELIEAFSIEQIQRAGGAFNEEKLRWMNKEYLNQLNENAFFNYAQPFFVSANEAAASVETITLTRLMPTIRERIQVGHDLTEQVRAGEYDFCFTDPVVTASLLQWKKDPSPQAAKPRLERVRAILDECDFSDIDSIKNALWEYAEKEGKGEVLWPLRVALTGRERSPDPFTVAYIIGRAATIRRLEAAINVLLTSE